MKINYDPEVDVIRITLKDGEIEESDEETPGIILDFDASRNVLGIEILQASKRIDNPQAIALEGTLSEWNSPEDDAAYGDL